MVKDPVIEEIKQILKETALADQRRREEFERRMEESRAENKRRKEEFDREMAEWKADRERQAQEDEKRRKALDEQMRKTDIKVNKLSDKIDRMTNNQGDIVEEIFKNSIIKNNLKVWGIVFDDIYINIGKHNKKGQTEYDILLINGSTAAIIEVKSKAHLNDIARFESKIERFRLLFTEYASYDLYIGIASLHINADIIKECKENGYGILKFSGDTLEEPSIELTTY